MRTLRPPIKLLRDRQAATAVEYGLILALIVITIIGAVALLGTKTSAMWNRVSSKVSEVVG